MDPIAQNIAGVQQLVGSKTNKVLGGAFPEEGIEGEKKDIFEVRDSDEKLIQLTRQWESEYASYDAKIKLRQQANKTFYLGRQRDGTPQAVDEGDVVAANLLFEAEETFLPAALSKNPEPVVWSDNTEIGNAIANAVKTMLQFHADHLVLRRKLTLMTRKWSLDFLGVIKHGWDSRIEDIKTEVKDAKRFIFDINGYVDSYGDFIGHLGERIEVTAEKLIEMFPKKSGYITVLVDGKLGTNCVYTEWWNDEKVFYTFKDIVLDKHKNPHFNYGQEEINGVTGQMETIPGKNHFAFPKKPYTFLAVFNLGTQPHDDTGLIEQNIPNQKLITRRTSQLDYNISRSNNSRAYSGANFTQQTAKEAATAMIKGHPVLIPNGAPIESAIKDFPPQPLPNAFFTDLQNNMNNLRSIYGTQGITATQQDEDQTARGMILNKEYDNSRIGGGIGDVIEQVADNVFNWWTQLYHVYYDEKHYASIMGKLKATEYIQLSSQDLNTQLVVSVSPDSMKPHDEITEMNQAMALYEAGVLDPLTLLTRLNFPNPKETAAQAVLWKINPQIYMKLNFPDIDTQIQQQALLNPTAPIPSPGGAPVPEQVTEPPPPEGGVTASPALSQVPLQN